MVEEGERVAQAGIQVNLTVREIYTELCEECREKLRRIVKDKISEQLVDQVVGVEA